MCVALCTKSKSHPRHPVKWRIAVPSTEHKNSESWSNAKPSPVPASHHARKRKIGSNLPTLSKRYVPSPHLQPPNHAVATAIEARYRGLVVRIYGSSFECRTHVQICVMFLRMLDAGMMRVPCIWGRCGCTLTMEHRCWYPSTCIGVLGEMSTGRGPET